MVVILTRPGESLQRMNQWIHLNIKNEAMKKLLTCQACQAFWFSVFLLDDVNEIMVVFISVWLFQEILKRYL